MNNHINLGTISEDFSISECSFKEVDSRSFLYSTNIFRPCSLENPIVWEDLSLCELTDVPDIVEKGDKLVTKEIAELIMAFDPYGVEVYPAKLIIKDKTINNRYILSVKSILDGVADEERSDIIENPIPNRPPIVSELAICPKKLAEVPLNKRLVFRVKESNTIYFDGSIVDKFIEDLNNGKHHLCQAVPFSTSELAPMI